MTTTTPERKKVSYQIQPEQNPNPPTLEEIQSQSNDGLRLVGKVVARRRRVVLAKKPGERNRFVIMLRVEGGGESRQAEMWSDENMPPGLPNIGEKVNIAVQIRCFVQGGTARHTLVFGDTQKGEAF